MDFNVFNIWYVNNLPSDATGVYLYTSERGDQIKLEGGTAVVVKNDIVQQVHKNTNSITIPKDGYIIDHQSNRKNMLFERM